MREQGADIREFETEHEAGYEGPGWRLLTSAALYEVEDAGARREGLLRMWRLWPDGWYGLVRWGDRRHATWVHESKLKPIDSARLPGQARRMTEAGTGPLLDKEAKQHPGEYMEETNLPIRNCDPHGTFMELKFRNSAR